MTTSGDDAGVRLRDATEHDADFLAWVMLAASRSHLSRGIWEYVNDQDEPAALAYLRELATTERVHLFHHSLFVIAEVDGRPAAAMCGYDPETEGFASYMAVLPEVFATLGMRPDDPEMARRAAVLVAGFPPPPAARPFVVENVATVPDFRRRGLVDTLLTEMCDRGRAKGFTEAQIGVFIGNEPARRAYVKAGFDVVGEQRDPRWDAEIGCPGTEVLLKRLA